MPSRILIVEDERLVAKNLELTLESLGYEVVGNVAKGEVAVELAEKLRPELVLMDIVLAGKMDGIAAAELIRSRYDIPIVYLSAYSDAPSLERVKKTEPYGYLTKPFVPFELHGTIETALYKHEMERLVRESEAALQESNERLEAFFNATTEVLCLLDVQGNYLALNRPALEVLGMSREAVLGKSHFQLLSHDPGGQRREAFDRVLQSGNPCKFEDRINGRVYECHFYPVFGPEQAVTAVAQFAVDMTERTAAEEALQANEQMLRSILATSPVGIGFTKRRKIKWVNDSWAKMFGFQHENDFIGKDAIILYPSREEYVRVGKLLYTGLANGAVTEADAKFQRADGTTFDANIRMSPLTPFHKTRGTISAITDISGRKKMEQDLRGKEERLKLALDGADLGLWDWNVATGEVVFNRRSAEIHGYCLEETTCIHFRWTDFIHPDEKDRVMDEVNAHLEARTPFYAVEYQRRHKSGGWIWIMSRGVVIERAEDGTPLRVVETHRDITERKRTEEALRASEEKYREMMERLPGLVFELDTTGEFVFINKAGREALGYMAEDVLEGMNIVQTIAPEDKERVRANLRHRLSGEAQAGLVYNVLRKDNTTFAVVTATSPIFSDGEVIGIRGVAIEIEDPEHEQVALRTPREDFGEGQEELISKLLKENEQLRREIEVLKGVGD